MDRTVSGSGLVVTPSELLLAIAEHEELEATCAALPGMTRERAQRLLRGVALALQRPEQAASEAVTRASVNDQLVIKPAGDVSTEAQPAASKHQVVMKPIGDASAAAPRAGLKHQVVIKPPGDASVGAPRAPAARASDASGRVLVYSDGASRGNPGPAGAGAVLVDENGVVLRRLGKLLGRETNNIAEYQGLLLGLRAALEMGAREVEVRADSELMIKQLKGDYRVKNEGLKPLFAEAQALLRKFAKVKLRHVPREENKLADEMSNRAIDERM